MESHWKDLDKVNSNIPLYLSVTYSSAQFSKVNDAFCVLSHLKVFSLAIVT